jgi:hypothetical protein
MYTESMARAFRSLDHFCPKGFSLQLIDNEHFITVKATEKRFMSLTGEGKKQAVEYMIRTKLALEQNGAIVLLVREGGEEL